jgi:hypothetical protein
MVSLIERRNFDTQVVTMCPHNYFCSSEVPCAPGWCTEVHIEHNELYFWREVRIGYLPAAFTARKTRYRKSLCCVISRTTVKMIMGNAGHIARMGNIRHSSKVIDRKPVGNRPVCWTKRKREDNIKVNLKERRYDGVGWAHVASNKDCWRGVMKRAMNLQIEMKLGEFSC